MAVKIGNPFDFRMLTIGKMSPPKDDKVVLQRMKLTRFERLYYKMGMKRRKK